MQNSSEHSSSSTVQAGVKRAKRTVFTDDDDALNTGGDAIGDKFDFEVPEPAADDSEAAAQPPPQKKAKKAKIVKF
eukprot:1203-Heterococcus_DN1.PRE.2